VITPVSIEPVPSEVAAAYAACEAIAKREAKNFYYAFRVLSRPKRYAMCAIYAFMRRADDISDDESFSIETRRVMMDEWIGAWRHSTIEDADPVFVAVRDTQARFAISDDLLEQLVQGTTMDLYPDETDDGELRGYKDFDALYRYCYLVASVVGLVCIRIFGYTDPRAEKLAEETGIAFQLTNILRDVKEDTERGRCYLPLDLMAGYGLNFDRLQVLSAGEVPGRNDREMLRALGEKAEVYYASAQQLLPLIDRDSRAALWVLVTIYQGVLKRIIAADYDVFSERASVPTREKLAILARGMLRSLYNRMLA
jgi:phytoene synthase